MKGESIAVTAGGTKSDSPSGETSTTVSGGGPLESFVLLSKTARGAAATNLIMQAISAPNVYVFGELLRCPNLQELAAKPETQPWWNLLQLFAYGMYVLYVHVGISCTGYLFRF